MDQKASGVLPRLFALYEKAPLYLRLFARIRLGHAGYDVVEAALPKNGRILDLGCGYGLFANYLALTSSARAVLGLELDARKFAHADRGVPRVSFQREDVTRAAFAERFDGIALLHVLHHLDSYAEQEALLARCVELLAPDGVLTILEIDFKPWWKLALTWCVDHALYPGDRIYFRRRADWEALLGRLGLSSEVVSMERGRPFSHVLYVCRRAGQSPTRR